MPTPSLLARLASLCARRKFIVLAVWLIAAVGCGLAARAAGSHFSETFNLPSTDSTQAQNLLSSRFPIQSDATFQVVFSPVSGKVTDPAVKAAMGKEFKALAALPDVASVASPYAPAGAPQISAHGRVAFADVQLSVPQGKVSGRTLSRLIAVGRSASSGTLRVGLGGQLISDSEGSGQSRSEIVGLLAAVAILILTFGSVVAMGLPIITALVALGSAMSLVTVATHVLSVANFAPELAAMIGLGVGIDYALFILTRYRVALADGLNTHDAVVRAIDTSGRAVLFAGMTVIIALLGMLLLGISFMNGLGICSALAVALTMAAALTLLPALLALLGHNVERLRPPGLGRLMRARHTGHHGMWGRWAGAVQRRPVLAGVAATLVLLALSVPAMSLRLGTSDAGSDPAGSPTRVAYDLLVDGFGAGYNGPLEVAAVLPHPGDMKAATDLSRALSSAPGIVSVQGPLLNRSGKVVVFMATPRFSPQSAQTSQLIKALRAGPMKALQRTDGMTVHVGGATAMADDLGNVLNGKLPLFIGVVVGLSALLLLAVFRSVAVALKAVVMNLLSIGAALGVLVAVFQWGWLDSVIGVSRTGPVEAFLPVMLFAIVFGLSMDYEVFLLSRIHEEWEHTGDPGASVRTGIAQTGRVITAAAAIMVMVFASFVSGDQIVIKEFGVGLACAIAVDAVAIRCVLVPAVMALLDRHAWWIPGWLDRLLPRLAVEPGAHAVAQSDDTGADRPWRKPAAV